MSQFNYDDVTEYGLDKDLLEEILRKQIECTFIWGPKDHWAVGVLMTYIWKDGSFWVSATSQRKRISAIKRDPRVSVVVSSHGTDLGPAKGITAKGHAIIHDDQPTKDWFYPACAAVNIPTEGKLQDAFARMLDTERRIVIGPIIHGNRMAPDEIQGFVDLYDAEIRYTDHELGGLLDRLRSDGRLEDTLIVVTADHGESLGEHGYFFEHGDFGTEPEIRIPLILRAPGLVPAGVGVEATVSNLDIAPTILDFAGVPAPDDLPGLVLGTGAAPRSIAEGSLWAGDLVSIRSDQGTLIENRTKGVTEFYDPADRFDGKIGARGARGEKRRKDSHAQPRCPRWLRRWSDHRQARATSVRKRSMMKHVPGTA